ncbi:pyridoxal 5'-phosphate synthase [Actinophytocola sp.]|uniref:pyridoxal 5'-phosphate synthase n=1 Tax=Actinophytocola sp. TaxID=1872138 RepID=UPI002ED231D5
MAERMSTLDEPPGDPIVLLRTWFQAAVDLGVREPGAFALATASGAGRASNRTVQALRTTDRGLVFTTHANSRKGHDIATTGWASAVLYWRECGRQIVLGGPAVRLPDHECDALWFDRPAEARAMSFLARQGEPLEDERILRARARELAECGTVLRRPDTWAGYELVCHEVEFWQASSDRLHHRLRYDQLDDGWTFRRLQP